MMNTKQSGSRPSYTTNTSLQASAARVLTQAEGRVARRADALFKSLASDYLLREQFVTDPAGILTEYVRGGRLDEEATETANQLIYAVMSNPRLRDWLGSYAMRLRGGIPTRHGVAREFARALVTRGDEATALAVIRGAAGSRRHFLVQADLLRVLITVIGSRFVGGSGTEMSPGNGTEMSPGTGTEMSPGTGTEMSPGTGTEMSPGTGTEMSPGAIFSGTEMSPGTGTEMSPGGTEMSPGAIFSGTEMSPGTGTEMSPGGTEMSPGAIFSGTEMSPGTGTEMSPGTGTEMSPGTGTEMSPGALGGILRVTSHMQVVLSALVQYSNQLRTRGALQTSGLENR
jgi:hypothetical protein